jgi:predicted RecA/RadA family phage recombinase
MNNFKSIGENLTLTAPSGGVVSGLGYLIGSLFVVATVTADETELFVGRVIGVVTLVKTTGEAWTEGAKVYWDNSAKKVTTTSSGNTLIGVAAAAAASADTEGDVRLDGVAR